MQMLMKAIFIGYVFASSITCIADEFANHTRGQQYDEIESRMKQTENSGPRT